jgi:hypothetical protein
MSGMTKDEIVRRPVAPPTLCLIVMSTTFMVQAQRLIGRALSPQMPATCPPENGVPWPASGVPRCRKADTTPTLGR